MPRLTIEMTRMRINMKRRMNSLAHRNGQQMMSHRTEQGVADDDDGPLEWLMTRGGRRRRQKENGDQKKDRGYMFFYGLNTRGERFFEVDQEFLFVRLVPAPGGGR